MYYNTGYFGKDATENSLLNRLYVCLALGTEAEMIDSDKICRSKSDRRTINEFKNAAVIPALTVF